MLTLCQHAVEYIRRNNLRSDTLLRNCRRFERFTGLTDSKSFTPEVLIAYRSAALAAGLSPVTIEKTLVDVGTITKHSCGQILERGKQLARKRPSPRPVPIGDLNAVWTVSAPWLRRWFALAYWTGLRVSDSLVLFMVVRSPCTRLQLTASKTGHHHSWPVPEWFHALMPQVRSPILGTTTHYGNTLRDELQAACILAGVAEFTPKQVRQRSITEWSRANATAGAIIHGCGLGVLSHYIDPLCVLEAAAPRLRLPACFGAVVSESEQLLSSFTRLDPAGQRLICETAERLAAG